MKPNEPTVAMHHKHNGIGRVFTETQRDLMGKNSRKMFKLGEKPGAVITGNVDAEEADDAQHDYRTNVEVAQLEQRLAELKSKLEVRDPLPLQETDVQVLRREIVETRSAVIRNDSELATEPVTNTLHPENIPGATLEEANNDIPLEEKATATAQEIDPNPELTALRARYTAETGNQPKRLSVEKMNEEIGVAQARRAGQQARL